MLHYENNALYSSCTYRINCKHFVLGTKSSVQINEFIGTLAILAGG